VHGALEHPGRVHHRRAPFREPAGQVPDPAVVERRHDQVGGGQSLGCEEHQVGLQMLAGGGEDPFDIEAPIVGPFHHGAGQIGVGPQERYLHGEGVHAILFEKLELLKPLSFELFVRVQEHLPIESSQSPFELLVLPLKLLDFVVELFFSHEYLLGPSSPGAFG
jgi:hypothetical protein